MADFGKKVQTDNKHLEDLASAKYLHVDGSVTTAITVNSVACNLSRVVLNTNGATVTLKSGTQVIGIIASDAPEGTFNYGVYCDLGLTVTCGGGVDATIVFN